MNARALQHNTSTHTALDRRLLRASKQVHRLAEPRHFSRAASSAPLQPRRFSSAASPGCKPRDHGSHVASYLLSKLFPHLQNMFLGKPTLFAFHCQTYLCTSKNMGATTNYITCDTPRLRKRLPAQDSHFQKRRSQHPTPTLSICMHFHSFQNPAFRTENTGNTAFKTDF